MDTRLEVLDGKKTLFRVEKLPKTLLTCIQKNLSKIKTAKYALNQQWHSHTLDQIKEVAFRNIINCLAQILRSWFRSKFHETKKKTAQTTGSKGWSASSLFETCTATYMHDIVTATFTSKNPQLLRAL